jgi:hypothetical protein
MSLSLEGIQQFDFTEPFRAIPQVQYLLLGDGNHDFIQALGLPCNGSNLRTIVLNENRLSDSLLRSQIPNRLSGIVIDNIRSAHFRLLFVSQSLSLPFQRTCCSGLLFHWDGSKSAYLFATLLN